MYSNYVVKFFLPLLLVAQLFVCTFSYSEEVIPATAENLPEDIASELASICELCSANISSLTGVGILEYGEEALMSRAWLTRHAAKSIDVQYFIWSTDNIGILASEALLQAAERGVKVRVLVDDLLIDAEDKTLLLLDRHPNVEIRIYNPKYMVGVSTWQRIINIIKNFRSVNQRMHDKTAIFDDVVGITGGRNMADEYFDYDHHYNFRDRDVLLIGKAVKQMSSNFNEFWESDYAIPVSKQLSEINTEITAAAASNHWKKLHDYANDNSHFEPQVRNALTNFRHFFITLMPKLIWTNVHFLSDKPGKNNNDFSLGGGGEITQRLADVLRHAHHSVVIESPYFVLNDEALTLFSDLIGKGVKISVITNSLASTDNLMAFSGYHDQRGKLLAAGIEIHEFKPHPDIQKALVKRYEHLRNNHPVLALHAKSMVVDGEIAFVGTFNLDPRSMNLNTEVGMLVKDARIAKELQGYILRDMQSGNSWAITSGDNPDSQVEWIKRIKLYFYEMLPMQAVL